MSDIRMILESQTLRLRGLVYPQKDELDLGLATAVSGGQEMYVSRKAAPSLTLVRSFVGVRDEDYKALKDWYANVAEGSRNTFQFIDGDGLTYLVRWTNSLADWQRDAENRWSGTMNLRVEDFGT